MPEDKLISLSSYPGSARYSMSLFLTTAKQVHQEDNDESADAADSVKPETE
jgi:hypothetical protein